MSWLKTIIYFNHKIFNVNYRPEFVNSVKRFIFISGLMGMVDGGFSPSKLLSESRMYNCLWKAYDTNVIEI